METYEVLCASPQQFQQPLHNSEIDTMAAENRFSYQYFDALQQNRTKTDYSEEENRPMNDDDDDDDLRRILKGLLKEFDVKGHEMFKKLVSRVEKDVPIEKLLREKLHKFKGKPGSDMLDKITRKLNRGGEEEFVGRERGVDGGTLQEERDKLERFKVKTVNVIGSGVVKEEGR